MICGLRAQTGAGRRNAPAIRAIEWSFRVEGEIESVQRCQPRRVSPEPGSDRQSAGQVERVLSRSYQNRVPSLESDKPKTDLPFALREIQALRSKP